MSRVRLVVMTQVPKSEVRGWVLAGCPYQNDQFISSNNIYPLLRTGSKTT